MISAFESFFEFGVGDVDHGRIAVRIRIWHGRAGEIVNQLVDFLFRQTGLQRNGMAASGLRDVDGALDVRRAGLPQVVDDVAQCLGNVLIWIGRRRRFHNSRC